MTKRPSARISRKSAYQREMEAYMVAALVTVAVSIVGFIAAVAFF